MSDKIYIFVCMKCNKKFEKPFKNMNDAKNEKGIHSSNGCGGQVGYLKSKEEEEKIQETKIFGEIATREDFIEISKKCIEEFIDCSYERYQADNNGHGGFERPKYCSRCGNKMNEQIECLFIKWRKDITFTTKKVCISCIEQDKKKNEEEMNRIFNEPTAF